MGAAKDLKLKIPTVIAWHNGTHRDSYGRDGHDSLPIQWVNGDGEIKVQDGKAPLMGPFLINEVPICSRVNECRILKREIIPEYSHMR